MKRLLCSKRFKGFACLVVLILANSSFAVVINTSGTSDGTANWYKWMNGQDKSTSTAGEVLGCYSDYYGGADYAWSMPVFQFNIASLAGMTEVDATVNLFCTALNNGGGISNFRFYNANGDGTIQFTQAQSGGIIASGDSPITTTGWLAFDVSAELQAAIDNGYDWAIFNVGVSRYSSLSIIASENTDPQYSTFTPQLTVVPEPATIALFAMGAAFLRRKKK